MHNVARRLLQVTLVVLLLWTVLGQVIVPVVATMQGQRYPEVAHLVVPYAVAGILAIGCVQVALLAVLRLLSLVGRGETFSPGAVTLVDVIAACAALATVLSAGPLLHLLFVEGVGGPLVLWLPAPLAGGLAVVLLMRVVRGVLESVIEQQRPIAVAT